MSCLSVIVAIAEDNAIGRNNQLLWHLPADLKHFKNLTTGHTIIMGRKTFDSIGKPLPNRRNIVISRNPGLEITGAEMVNSLNHAIALSKDDSEVFIIGGAEIYRQAFPLAQRLYLTRVHGLFEADTFFPKIDATLWKETHAITFPPDEKNALSYTFSTFERIA
ncbi:IS1595 family transposase ISSsu9 [compost metagenome]